MPTEVVTVEALRARIINTLRRDLDLDAVGERIAQGLHTLYAERIDELEDSLVDARDELKNSEMQLAQVEHDLLDHDVVIEATRAWHNAEHSFGLNLCGHPVCQAVCSVNR